MAGVLIFVHVVASVLLVLVILMQSGRGGGLTEGFAPAESIFGARTNQFMVRATAILTAVFFVTSLSMAYLSAKRESSLIPEVVPENLPASPLESGTQAPVTEVPPADGLQAEDQVPAQDGPFVEPSQGSQPEVSQEPQTPPAE